MAYFWSVGILLAFASNSLSGQPLDCAKVSAALAHSVTVQAEKNLYVVTDRSNPDFHVTGMLRSDGTLTISIFREMDDGSRMEADLGQVLDHVLKHFPGTRAIEVKLSHKDRVDDYKESREPLLEAFNSEWKKSRGQNETDRLNRAVQAVPELKQVADALGNKVKVALGPYTQRSASGRYSDRAEAGFVKLGLRFEATEPLKP